MSLHINFEPHSWYMGFAIGKYAEATPNVKLDIPYFAVTDNGNTYQIDTLEGHTLKDLKTAIKRYRKICVSQGCKKTNIDYNGVCPSHR